MAYRPEHPKWKQNLQFLPLSETTSIPVMIFKLESPEFPGGVTVGGGEYVRMHDQDEDESQLRKKKQKTRPTFSK